VDSYLIGYWTAIHYNEQGIREVLGKSYGSANEAKLAKTISTNDKHPPDSLYGPRAGLYFPLPALPPLAGAQAQEAGKRAACLLYPEQGMCNGGGLKCAQNI